MIEYIVRALSEGMTIADIRDSLLKKGWPESIIDHAINHLSMDRFKHIKIKDSENSE